MKRRSRVAGCILRSGDKILLLFRSEGETDPSLWGIPAGKVEHDETDSEAVAREVFEETGIRVTEESLDYLGLLPIEYDTFIVDFPIFAAEFDEKPNVTLDPREHIEYQWLKPSKVLALDNLMKDVHVIIEKFCIDKLKMDA